MPEPKRSRGRRYTVDEVLAFPDDGNRYELVEGELLVTPAPTELHQLILERLNFDLRLYMRSFGLADTVRLSPADILLQDDTLVQPDLFVVRPEEMGGGWKRKKNLRFVIEIISPSTKRNDKVTKLLAYRRNRVGTYWIVDPYERTVEVWEPDRPDARVETESVAWRHAEDAKPFVVRLNDLWNDPWGVGAAE